MTKARSVIYDISNISSKGQITKLLDCLDPKYIKLRVSTNQFSVEEAKFFLADLKKKGFKVFLSIEDTRRVYNYYNLACELNIWMLGFKNLKLVKELETDFSSYSLTRPLIVYEAIKDVLNNLSRFDELDGICSNLITIGELNDINSYAYRREKNFILINMYPPECLGNEKNFISYHLEAPIF